MNLGSRYNLNKIASKIYENWESKGCFKPQIDKSKKPYTIVIPPPNVTGQLHMGHALDDTIQDVLIRYNRMKGVPTLWLPGTDHASIATEVKVVEKIVKEGKTKEELGREGLTRAVEYVFVKLYEKGLIYQGKRIVNWCTCCKTSISDNEVEYEADKSHLWHIRYKVEGTDDYVVVATTRLETMLGDTAVAVHPEDERYVSIVGKNVILPIINKAIPVVADTYGEKDFGTGAVKITQFGTQLIKHLKLERFVERITNYFNENRRELVVC